MVYVGMLACAIFITCLNAAEGYLNYFPVEERNITRYRRQATCESNTKAPCKDGHCIDETLFCDGKYDCTDKSDETADCKNIGCPGYLFTCNYGACINDDLACNGITNCVDGSDEAPDKCNGRPSVVNCKKYQFKCDNDACIPDTDLCDGTAQCEDSSDETVKQCGHLQCPAFTFRCAYGGCINEVLKCNGVKNCVDNSDETNCTGVTPFPPITPPTPATTRPTTTRKPEIGDCLLPKRPRNGEWAVINPPGRYSPGQWVKPGAILQFSCKPTFKLFPEEKLGFGLYRNCKDGSWGGDPPVCIRTCSRSIVTNERMIVECIYNGGKTDCNNPYDGTRASIRCRDLYHDASLTYNPQRICTGDSWDYNPPTCDPDCGHKSVKPTELLIGAAQAVRAEYPWQVAIYLKKDQICGGSIISTKVILTAAHCFDSDKWDDYQIGAGKLYRSYEHPNDTDAQYRDVLDVKMLPEFNEGAYLGFDIALMILKKRLQITHSVRLICFDRSNFIDTTLTDAEGVITGWGYTKEHGDPSEILRKLQVKYFTTKECQKTLPTDFKTYYTPYVPDKMCAGVLSSNRSACQGDSGGPLAFRSQDDGRFYVRGIVSVGPFKVNHGCDASKLTLYTSVAFHKDYIIETLAKYNKLD